MQPPGSCKTMSTMAQENIFALNVGDGLVQRSKQESNEDDVLVCAIYVLLRLQRNVYLLT